MNDAQGRAHLNNQKEQTDVFREIRNEINTPELRDRIAIAVLGGVMSSPEAKMLFLAENPETRRVVTQNAYKWADAMLAARKK